MENQKAKLDNKRRDATNALADSIRDRLYEEDVRAWDKLILSGQTLLDESLAASDDDTANCAWFLQKLARMRRTYLSCVDHFRNDRFYEGWCGLEQVEIGLTSLKRNPFYDPDQFGVTELLRQVTNWQSLFPYRVFLSPEFVIEEEACSICDTSMSPWSSCTHKRGRVYGGRECYRIVRKCDLLAMALVREPVQKYSVARITSQDNNGKEIDQFDYSVVKYVLRGITSPFSRWNAMWTKALHPHDLFVNRSHDGPCPCESGRIYRDCCLNRRGVIRPHLQVTFAKPPAGNLPSVQFVGYPSTTASGGT
jgi:hypothetical protein